MSVFNEKKSLELSSVSILINGDFRVFWGTRGWPILPITLPQSNMLLVLQLYTVPPFYIQAPLRLLWSSKWSKNWTSLSPPSAYFVGNLWSDPWTGHSFPRMNMPRKWTVGCKKKALNGRKNSSLFWLSCMRECRRYMECMQSSWWMIASHCKMLFDSFQIFIF